ncbi:MAG: isoprenylcysteine carboxylmethyltransferase family protein [Acidobacteria bacterium]|nr:isoprenylcysteine carboxylmethyltransferase family protein [Acidobacteriota bacterium]
MNSYGKLAARMRVPSGFLVAALYLVYSRPRWESLAAGLAVALVGIALRAWAAGHLTKNEALATSGPFACTRNPLYLGTLTAAAGFALAGWNLWLALLFAAYFGAVYLPVIGEEESHLRKLFPEYAAYAARVPLLVPQFPIAHGRSGGFRWALYFRNQEYNALLGFLAGAVVLVWKTR